MNRSLCSLFTFLAVVLLGLFLQLPRAALTPQESDGGEYALAAMTGGVLHPPGYPLYSKITHELVKLYPENPYHTLAVFSAVSQSLAGGALFLAANSLSGNSIVAASVAVAWAFHEPSLRVGTNAEVFGMHHLLIGLMIFFWIFLRKRNVSDFCFSLFSGLTFGIACSHHQTAVFWAPVLLSLLCERAGGFNKKFVRLAVFTLLGFALGFTPYLLLLGEQNNLTNRAPQNLQELLRYVLRLDYGSFSLKAGGDENEVSYFAHFVRVSAPVLPLFFSSILIGLVLALRKRSALLIGFLAAVLLHLWFAQKLIISSHERIYAEWIMRFYPLITLSLALYFSLCVSFFPRKILLTMIIAAALVVPPLLVLKKSLDGADAKSDQVIMAEINAVLSEIPQKTIFMSNLDRLSMGLLYQQLLTKNQKEIIVVVAPHSAKLNYQEQLALYLPALGEPKPQTLKEFVDRARAAGYGVYSYQGTLPAEGYKAVTKGITTEWVPENSSAAPLEKTENILKLCTKFSDQLAVNRERVHSRTLVGTIFLKPLSDEAGATGSEAVRGALSSALKAFYQGDMAAVRNICASALEKIPASKQ
jgi:hypothetical protein